MPTPNELLNYALTPTEALEVLWQRSLHGDLTAHACHITLINLITTAAMHRCALDDVNRLNNEHERLSRAYVKLLDRVEHLEMMLDEAIEARRVA